jgi:hypothetical protein
MTKDEALRLALEALEKLWDIIDDIDTYSDMAKADEKLYRTLVERRQRQRFEETGISTDGYELHGGAITAIKAALEAKDEPVAWNAGIPSLYPKMKEGETISVEYVELTPLQQDGECKHCTDGCPACDARKLPEQEPVQVSPLEFVEMVMEKEHLVGKPVFWAEWPNKEKNT